MESWRSELTGSFTDAAVLRRHLDLPATNVTTDYPLLVPLPFVRRMQCGNPADPLLLQVLPMPEELERVSGFSADPLNESAAESAASGILVKYPHRALVLASPVCGIHCRFCFRRNTLPQKDRGFCNSFRLRFVTDDIDEIILSGGDPLMLSDEELGGLCRQIIKMPHIKRLRIHSRLPVVLPKRITTQLNKVLDLPIQVYLVLHVNHPNELDDELAQRLRLLRSPVLLSQSVLLRRINDDADTLEQLFRRLTDLGIVPYYLHQLDRVQGAAHFEVTPELGCRLMSELRSRLSGYAVPKYVREVPGQTCKENVEVAAGKGNVKRSIPQNN
ncbi:MAG: KamA family radical SAM protein [Planctomycetaceae bacterium]|jgi:EF-P beta-lysylation protein EpmB|nr:KamA family radical SAM protein [Planctomycetaceae bacterium]